MLINKYRIDLAAWISFKWINYKAKNPTTYFIMGIVLIVVSLFVFFLHSHPALQSRILTIHRDLEVIARAASRDNDCYLCDLIPLAIPAFLYILPLTMGSLCIIFRRRIASEGFWFWVYTFAAFFLLLHAARIRFLKEIVEGTIIPKPYAYRVLLPWTLKWLSYWTNSKSILLFILLATLFIFLLAFLFAMRQILELFYHISKTALNLFPVFLAFFLIPFFYGWNSYINDFPLLLFWALFVILMQKNRIGIFYLVFLLSCLNKETTILIIPVFFYYFLRNKARIRWLIYHGFLQLVIFGAIRIAILVAMKDHPGRAFEFWLNRNVEMIIRPLSFPIVLTFGFVPK